LLFAVHAQSSAVRAVQSLQLSVIQCSVVQCNTTFGASSRSRPKKVQCRTLKSCSVTLTPPPSTPTPTPTPTPSLPQACGISPDRIVYAQPVKVCMTLLLYSELRCVVLCCVALHGTLSHQNASFWVLVVCFHRAAYWFRVPLLLRFRTRC
jgi:hypothetical protein